MTDKLKRRLLGRGKPKATALRDVAPNVDVDALLKRGDLATLASASRELESRARAALAGFVEECRLTIEYEELKSTVKEDLKAVAALLKQRALPSAGDAGAGADSGPDTATVPSEG